MGPFFFWGGVCYVRKSESTVAGHFGVIWVDAMIQRLAQMSIIQTKMADQLHGAWQANVTHQAPASVPASVFPSDGQ